MEKRIEGKWIVFTKENEFGKVGCHIPQDMKYDEVKIEKELDKGLENLKLKNKNI